MSHTACPLMQPQEAQFARFLDQCLDLHAELNALHAALLCESADRQRLLEQAQTLERRLIDAQLAFSHPLHDCPQLEHTYRALLHGIDTLHTDHLPATGKKYQ